MCCFNVLKDVSLVNRDKHTMSISNNGQTGLARLWILVDDSRCKSVHWTQLIKSKCDRSLLSNLFARCLNRSMAFVLSVAVVTSSFSIYTFRLSALLFKAQALPRYHYFYKMVYRRRACALCSSVWITVANEPPLPIDPMASSHWRHQSTKIERLTTDIIRQD